VCSAFLVRWSDKLQEMDFQVRGNDLGVKFMFSQRLALQGIIMFLQSLPTQDWTDDDIELLLSRAFVLSSTWHRAQSHFLSA
jgi:GAF domain-containing protein